MTPPPPLQKSPLPHNIDPGALLDRLTDPNIPIIEIARELGVTAAQILDAAEHPIITSMLARMNRLDRRRARRQAAAAAPAAIQTLDLLTIDRSANPETRRKAATKILSITSPTKPRSSAPPPSPLGGEGRGEGFSVTAAQRRAASAPLSRRERAGERGDWNQGAQTQTPHAAHAINDTNRFNTTAPRGPSPGSLRLPPSPSGGGLQDQAARISFTPPPSPPESAPPLHRSPHNHCGTTPYPQPRQPRSSSLPPARESPPG